MTWQIGDLAVCVDDSPCQCCGCSHPVSVGRIYRVEGFGSGYVPKVGRVITGLVLQGVGSVAIIHPREMGINEARFRKVVSDKAEQCEPEFVTLLKRIKRTVPAPTETASAWLLRVAPLARRLNLESKFDTRQTRKEGDK